MNESLSPAIVVLNPGSGSAQNGQSPELTQQILRDAGCECELRRLSEGDDLCDVVTRAVRSGVRTVIAAGGDGTLRGAAQALAGTGVAMGILPVGTLNHFARDLEIPLDPAEAARVFQDPATVDLDVAEVNQRVFVNNAVIGLYPAYRAEREAREKRGWQRKLASLSGWLAVFRRYPFVYVRLRTGLLEIVRRTPLLIIGNNEHAMEGFEVWKRESLTEGALWIYISRDQTRWSLLRVIWQILTGTFKARDHFDVLRAAEIVVETRRKKLSISLDGEIFHLQTPLRFQSRPANLKVLVPRSSKRASEAAAAVAGGS